MLVVFFRALILFAVVFVCIRLMGKRELSKIQPFELAIIVMISDLASGPMSSRDMSTFSGIIPIVTLLIVYIIVTCIIKISNKTERALCGAPTLIIHNGKLLEKNIEKENLTTEEIMSQLREQGIFKIQDAAFAILETSGKLNAQSLDSFQGSIPLNVIAEGEYLDENINLLGITKKDVEKFLQLEKLELNDVLLATVDENGKFIYQKRGAKR